MSDGILKEHYVFYWSGRYLVKIGDVTYFCESESDESWWVVPVTVIKSD